MTLTWLLPPALRKDYKLRDKLRRWHSSKCWTRSSWILIRLADSNAAFVSHRGVSHRKSRCTRPSFSCVVNCKPGVYSLISEIKLYANCPKILWIHRHFYSFLTLHICSAPAFWNFTTTVLLQYLALVRNAWFKLSSGGKELPHTSRFAKLSYDKRWGALSSFSGLKALWLGPEMTEKHLTCCELILPFHDL